jgi:hypothetical protein
MIFQKDKLKVAHDEHDHDHGHDHEAKEEAGHAHTHGIVDPSILTTQRGIWAVKWSFVGLGLTAIKSINCDVVIYGPIPEVSTTSDKRFINSLCRRTLIPIFSIVLPESSLSM